MDICREQATHPEAQWRKDEALSENCSNLTGIREKGGFLFDSHISPDGRHIMICTNGIKIY